MASTSTSTGANTNTADTTPYTLTFYSPTTHTSSILPAIFATGAGSYPGGLYAECCFIIDGRGQFRPTAKANPAIGKPGDLETVEEQKIEIFCEGRECVERAVKALKEAHPYEQVAYFIVKGETI